MDYTDEIHFLQLQLDKIAGSSNWPWRTIADFVGCSTTTVRKYCQQPWMIETKDLEYCKDRVKSLTFKNRVIEKLIPDGETYYLDSSLTIMKKKNPTVETKENSPPLQTIFKLGTIKNWPERPGIYLFCQVACPCNRPNEKYYLIKIGMSSNLKNRIKAYGGMNPLASCIDVRTTATEQDAKALEIKAHMAMAKKWVRAGGTEWFIVPEEDYKVILQYGIKKNYLIFF